MSGLSTARVLYFSSGRSFSTAAPPRKIPAIVNCWRKQGHNVELVYGGDLPGGLNGTGAPPRASGERLPWYRRTSLLAPMANTISERRDIEHNCQCIDHLRKVTELQPFDLIWERSSRLHDAGLVVARERGLPYVLEWKDHLIEYRLSLYHGRAVAAENRKNQSSDSLVVESGVLRDQLAADGVDREKIIVAHNAVDPGLFRRDEAVRRATRSKLGIADDEVLAGYLGGYQFYHDTVRLVLAADLLRVQGQRKIKILMIGNGTEYFETRRVAEKLGLLEYDGFMMKPRIPESEVPGVLAALDVAVLPGSTDIICPIKVQEYMAAELPTVLPDYPANREVVDHGETGLSFRPRDGHALAEALRSLADNQDHCRRMGKRARCVVCERFTWEKTWGAALTSALERGWA